MENQTNYITKLRKNYTPHESTKLDRLKELDKKVKFFPSVLAYVLGTVAALILGTGMCLAMNIIGATLMPPAALMAVGIVVGCVGIALCIANYYVYRAVLKSRKKKYGGEIIALSNELLNENK